MRSSLLLAIALLFTLPLSDFQRPPLQRDRPQKDGPQRNVRTECLCQDASPHRPPASIEDETLKRQLLRAGTSLIEAKRTVPSKKLIEQLQRNTASVKLLDASPATCGLVEMIDSAKQSVVVVSGFYKCPKCTHWHAGTASGFVIAPDGVIVTNFHVVNDSGLESIIVMTADGRVLPVEEVLAGSRRDDLAVLRVSATDLVPLPIVKESVASPVGTAVTVISHPDGQHYTSTAGIVSRYFRSRSEEGPIDEMAITADYARGSSGAPVLNAQGHVIGIVKCTESVYYTENAQQQRDLQMVFKTCVPASSLARIIRNPAPQYQVKAAADDSQHGT
jgi:hypothetical protein